jgi:hypothetical protein
MSRKKYIVADFSASGPEARIVQDSQSNPLQLIIAERSLGNEGFGGSNTVTFSKLTTIPNSPD